MITSYSIKKFQKYNEMLESEFSNIHYKCCEYKLFGADGYLRSFDIQEDEIEIKWDISWNYGGYDSGTYYIPLHIICGDWNKWLDDEISGRNKKEREAKEKALKAQEEAERATLHKLQQKYSNQTSDS